MRTTPVLLAALCAAVLPLAVRAQSAPADDTPAPQLSPAESASFDAQSWSERLTAADLDARERAFEELVAHARAHPEARSVLEEWAADGSEERAGLAWTSRLALRELDARGAAAAPQERGIESLLGPDADLRGWLDQRGLGQGFEELERWLGDLQSELDRAFPGLGAGGALGSPGVSSHSGSTSVEITPDGVRVEVTEERDGEAHTQTYEAATLEELYEAHPELRERLGVRELRGGTLGPLFGGGGLRGFGRGGAGGLGDLLGGLRPGVQGAGDVRTDLLGIECRPARAEELSARGTEHDHGLLVERVVPGTIAQIVGLRRGDLVVAVGGRAIEGAEDVAAALREREADAELTVTAVDAHGRERTLTWHPAHPHGEGLRLEERTF